jgi:multidrug efflux system membrane fusion protein
VQRGQDGTYTYVVDSDGQTVHNRPITVANIQDNVAIIDKGVTNGERVVVDGQYKLKPGSRIVETAKKPAGGASAVVAEADAKSDAGDKK